MSDNEIPTPWLKTLDNERKTAIEYEKVTTFEFVKRRAENEPNDPCIIFPKGKVLSYADLLDSIKRLAVVLKDKGIKKGDRVALMLGNTPHYFIGHFAIMAIGAIVVQTNPIYSRRELVHILKDSGARGIISITLFQDKISDVIPETDIEFAIYGNISEYLKPIVAFIGKLLRKLDDPKFKNLPNNYFLSDLLANADPSKFKEAEIDLDKDIALLQYTGGTTGLAKGAMLTFGNVSYNAQQTRALIPTVPDKTGSILTVLPLFHSFGLTVCMGNSFQMGVPMVLQARFNAKDALKLIEKYKITFFPGVPTMMVALLNDPNATKVDLSSLIAVFSGGAPLPVEVAKKFQDLTKGAQLVEGYGLSETSPVATCNPIGSKKIKPREGSIGLPAADTLVKIVDTDDYSVLMPIGEPGEICIKGPQVMQGYWNEPEASKQALNDGWLLTGDIGKMDEDGYIYIVDRKKDLIIVSGNNVVPREVEEVLYQHPAILEAAVAGLHHDVKGEMVAAWVVLKEGETATDKNIIEFCRQNLAPYKVPKQITFREELPKSMIGKILRRKLTEKE